MLIVYTNNAQGDSLNMSTHLPQYTTNILNNEADKKIKKHIKMYLVHFKMVQ